MSELLTILGLAIAGIDPVGAIVLAGAISAGLEKSKIIGFSVAVLLGAVVTGTLFSVIGIQFIDQVKNFFSSLSSSIWVYVNVALAVLIIVWLYRQLKPKSNAVRKPPKKRKLQGGILAVIGLGAIFGASSVLDPTFVAAIGVAAQTGNVLAIIGLHTVWITLSQFMLFGLLAAYLFGKHQQLLDWSKAFWHKHKPSFMRVVRFAAFAVSIVLIADSIAYLVSGSYLLF
jgi:MFS family permease